MKPHEIYPLSRSEKHYLLIRLTKALVNKIVRVDENDTLTQSSLSLLETFVASIYSSEHLTPLSYLETALRTIPELDILNLFQNSKKVPKVLQELILETLETLK